MLIRRFTLVAIAFELLLGLLGALLAAWLLPGRLLQTFAGPRPLQDVGWGLLAALPLAAGLVWIDRHPVGILRRLSTTVHEDVVPLFRGTSTWGLLAISVAAGLGEELLFRGFLQSAAASAWGAPHGGWVGLLLASVAFGLCHSLCAAYAVLATLMGLVLGGLYLATAHLAAPIATHTAYDFLALLYLVRWSDAARDPGVAASSVPPAAPPPVPDDADHRG
jgi:membrane protease YdiL (CAAX protease family)